MRTKMAPRSPSPVRLMSAPHAPLLASTLHLPAGPWTTVLDCLCQRFPAIPREVWLARMRDGKVQDLDGRPLDPQHPYREGLRVRYFRELAAEPPIPFEARVLHQDAHLLVVDKPHFLPVVPAGAYVEQTLLARLVRSLGNPELVPLHRIDRLTAGLVLFSCNPASRARYQALFRQRRIEKYYQALAPALPQLSFPLLRRSRILPGEPFFRMREVDGEANSETRIEVLERGERFWRYGLQPLSGRKHQLRVQMAGLGAAILGDPLYPQLRAECTEDFSQPLQLLAQALAFDDPLDGRPRHFVSRLSLPG